ncbi:MAG: type II toxin-antitoxin system YafQ family toxin [Kiritimatiellia bacterium]
MTFEMKVTARFRKDYKIAKKRGLDLEKLDRVMTLLHQGDPLPLAYRDHVLTGDYVNTHECHIAPDWLLIYMFRAPFLIFVRTGTHSDLF